MRNGLTRLLLLIALALGATACVKAPPQTAGIPLPLDQAQVLLAGYQNRPALRSLSAFADASVEYRGRVEFFSAAILAQSPDRLRIELMDDLGQTLARLISDGKAVTWWDSRSGETQSFAPGDPALQKAFRIPLSVEDFIARILLRIPEDEILEFRELEGNPPLQWIDRTADRLAFEGATLILKTYEKKKTAGKSKPLYAVEYGYSGASSSTYPTQMKWAFFKPAFQMKLKLREVGSNEKLAPEKFNPYPNLVP